VSLRNRRAASYASRQIKGTTSGCSRGPKVRPHPETKAVVDSGYRGFQGRHANMAMPKKRSKKNLLSAADRKRNRAISSERVACENVIALLKCFKIIAGR
jgi:hypothetical protein